MLYFQVCGLVLKAGYQQAFASIEKYLFGKNEFNDYI
jgi:hypothetical protein